MLVVPYSHDQPDNAMRVARLGVARTIVRDRYRAGRVAAELHALLSGDRYSSAARRTAIGMAGEEGVRAACDGLEAALGKWEGHR
jgi:rhamnosyltransferase subunit B